MNDYGGPKLQSCTWRGPLRLKPRSCSCVLMLKHLEVWKISRPCGSLLYSLYVSLKLWLCHCKWRLALYCANTRVNQKYIVREWTHNNIIPRTLYQHIWLAPLEAVSSPSLTAVGTYLVASPGTSLQERWGPFSWHSGHMTEPPLPHLKPHLVVDCVGECVGEIYDD